MPKAANTTNTKKDTRLSQYFLERMKLVSFGAFSNKMVGPFTPGLNVVFGKNEAGKTTLNAFLSGVLFGWEDARGRGQKNTYKPADAERAGSLFFSSVSDDDEIELSRNKNVEGLQGPNDLVEDIDKETFSTMFALTSDELRSLRKTTDVTAKLLTAGSGTNTSPAETLARLQKDIQSYTSKATQIEHSLVNIEAELDALREQVSRATDEANQFKLQDKEFHEITPQREQLLDQMDKLNEEIQSLTAGKVTLERIEGQLEQAIEKKRELAEEQQLIEGDLEVRAKGDVVSHQNLGALEEAALRDQIDKHNDERSKYEIRISTAQDNYLTSKAAYDALIEAENLQGRATRMKRQRRIQTTLAIVFPIIFMIAGMPMFMRGRELDSLSFTMLGLLLIICALIMAAGALFVLFRPTKTEEELEKRKEDAQWVMLQDKKKVEACEADLILLDEAIRVFLDEAGLGEANGSLRQARVILDEVQEKRNKETLNEQRRQALFSQATALKDSLNEIEEHRKETFEKLKLDPEASITTIENLIERKSQQRMALMETSENLNRRYGELRQELAQAKNMRDLDKYKLLYEEAITRQQESAQNYARLIMARHMLEAAIRAWESKSQPEVYARASELFKMMTAGKWTQVKINEEGELQVVDALKTTRDPLLLSLGTCQQLYLSLRIALLMTAENVGKVLPIMADDILVNFDEERRAGAAQALVELAEKRQIILFTCHKEVVSLMCEAGSQVNLVEL